MKKQLLNLSLVAMFVAVTGYVMAAPATPPVRALEIAWTATPPVMDGVAEGVYGASQNTIAFNTTGSTGADPDFTMSFQVCADYQKLYVMFTVLDDYACEAPYTTSANPWTWDNEEIFLSLDTTSTTTAYDTNTIQLRVNRGIQDSAQSPGRAAQEDWLVYSEDNASGDVIECGIPWTAVLQTGAVPEDIEAFLYPVVNGFDISGADNDTDGPDARDCQTAWDEDDPAPPDATEDLAWNNRTMFGVMTLTGFPELGTHEVTLETLGLYPNPATGTINLDLNEMTNVEIFNVAGVMVKSVLTNKVVDVNDLASGLYMVRTNNGMAKFMKQ
jgi:hypothetical protein